MNVLLLDSDRATGPTLQPLLDAHALTTATRASDGLRLLASGGWDVVLLDADFGGTAMELLGRLRSDHGPPVVVLLREPSMQVTLEAIERGALDVLSKPPAPERVREILGTLEGGGRVWPLPERPAEAEEIVGGSAQMLDVFRALARAAGSDATVLVLGESGTGKEMAARVLHSRSPRAHGPFIAVNCAALPEHLLESELFGHEKGAFTGAIGRRIGRFERASGGTLFLDEVGDMSMALQAKILRALQEREVERVGGEASVPIDVRIVAATNKDLADAVDEGRFREDLFYRLAVVSVRMPPLRHRGADLELLAGHFAALYAHEYRRGIRAIAEETLEVLRGHSWPGNVRQLRNAMERAVVMCEGEVLLPRHLPVDVRRPELRPGTLSVDDAPLCTLAEMERRLIRRALLETGRNSTLAAERLGIHRNTLRRKITEYGLDDH